MTLHKCDKYGKDLGLGWCFMVGLFGLTSNELYIECAAPFNQLMKDQGIYKPRLEEDIADYKRWYKQPLNSN